MMTIIILLPRDSSFDTIYYYYEIVPLFSNTRTLTRVFIFLFYTFC